MWAQWDAYYFGFVWFDSNENVSHDLISIQMILSSPKTYCELSFASKKTAAVCYTNAAINVLIMQLTQQELYV